MTKSEFNTQMGRLAKTYKGFYSEEHQQLLARQIKDFSENDFRKVIDDLISSELRPPSVKHIVERFVKVRERYKPLNTGYIGYTCKRCSDSGWEFIDLKDYPNSVMKCTCEKGRSIILPIKF